MKVLPSLEASKPAVTTTAPPCPWCGQLRVRGVTPSTDGNQWYRCGACLTTFFIRVPPRRLAACRRV
jgi:transposase-like protein